MNVVVVGKKQVRFCDTVECIHKEIKIVPEFQMKNVKESLEKGLSENGCFCVLKVCKLISRNVDIRAVIAVKKTCFVSRKPAEEDSNRGIHGKLKHPIKTLMECIKNSKQQSSSSDSDSFIAPIGVTSLVWSADEWNTWESIEATYLEQAKDYLLYEVTLKNVQKYIDDGEKIGLACFHQNQNGLFGDTNNSQSYTFRRTDLHSQTDI